MTTDLQVERLRAFEALPEAEKDILAVLAAAGEGLARTKVALIGAAAGLKSPKSRRALTAGALKELLQRWEAEGLTLCDKRHQYEHACYADISHWALQRAVETGLLPSIRRALDSIFPLSPYGYYSGDGRRALRDVRLAVYQGEVEAAARALSQIDARQAAYNRRDPPPSLASVFGGNLPPKGLQLFSEQLLERYVADLLQLALEELIPIGAASWSACKDVAAGSVELMLRVLVVCLLRGDAAELRELARGPRGVAGDAALAFLAMLDGDVQALGAHAAGALELSRGPKKTRRPRIEGVAEHFLALPLLCAGDEPYRAQARDLITLRRKRDALSRKALEPLAAFDEYLRSPTKVRRIRDAPWTLGRTAADWARVLFWGLYALFTEQRGDAHGVCFEASDAARKRALECGYHWLERQLSRTVDALAPRRRRDLDDGFALIDLYRPREPWERTLDALADVARASRPQQRAGAEDDRAQQVRWIVRAYAPRPETASGDDLDEFSEFDHHDDEDEHDDLHEAAIAELLDLPFEGVSTEVAEVADGFDAQAQSTVRRYRELLGPRHDELHVEPKLQRRKAKGWTAGSNVSLRKLQKLAREGKLPDEDAQVCAHIRRESEWGTPRYTFDVRVGIALVGHPRVHWADGDGQVEVLSREPTLVVKEQDGQLALTMMPHGADEDTKVVYKREGDQLVVYPLAAHHHRIAAVIGDGVAMPPSSHERLQQTLGELATLIPLQSPLTVKGGATERVGAESRSVVLLRRQPSSGLLVRARVFPLGLDGPAFAPGQGPENVAAQLGGRVLTTERELATERAGWTALRAACPSLPPSATSEECAVDDLIGCYELLTELARCEEGLVRVAWPEGKPLSVVAERDVRDLKLRIESAGDWFAARGTMEVDENRVLDLAELLSLMSGGAGRFIELEDGQVIALSRRLRRRLEDLAAHGRSKRKALELSPVSLFALEDWGEDDGTITLDDEVRGRLDRLREARTLSCPAPRTLQAELRDYQREGYRWLCRLSHWGGGACLADDMGLGKTLQVLALLLTRAERGPSLVVAPTSVCGGWIEQASRFCPTLRPRRYGGGDRQAMLAGLTSYDLLVVSYGLLVQDIDAIAEVAFDVAVLDEAQAIKNAATRRAKAARRIAARTRIVTTGTPVENHLGEIWSQMHFLNPGLLGSVKQFQQRFARPIEKDGDERVAAQLRRLLRPFVLRRTKAQVLEELPPKTELVLRIAPEAEQAALYEAVRRQAISRMADKATPKERMRLLGELMRVRRAACHPRLVSPDCGLGSAKLETLFELIEELRDGDHQALVFSQFVDHLSLVRERLSAEGISYQYLDGSTPAKKREAAVAAFQRGEGDLFLISLRAGGFGLNLTAADYVIHLDPWWNPAVEDQASDRAHRIGQERPVTICKLVTEGTIEEKILELHGDKRQLAQQLLAGSEKSTTLTVQQLRELLQTA